MELLKVENLTFTYPKQNPDAAEPEPTLQNVSFQVQEGAFVVVCGESGCGKTTLLKLLKRELAPAGERSGNIWFHGVEQAALTEREAACEIGFVLQIKSGMNLRLGWKIWGYRPRSFVVEWQRWHVFLELMTGSGKKPQNFPEVRNSC